jgi:hypothetical protein
MPRLTTQPCCYKYDCQVTYATAHALKSQEKRVKADRKETRERKEKLKSRTQWFNECKAIAQKIARIRDRHEGCISCEKTQHWSGQWHGSHFRPAGNFKSVALNLLNIHKACSECNGYKSGNLIPYQDKLILKIGLERVEWLKAQQQPHTFSIDYLKKYKRVMGKWLRRIERRAAVN